MEKKGDRKFREEEMYVYEYGGYWELIRITSIGKHWNRYKVLAYNSYTHSGVHSPVFGGNSTYAKGLKRAHVADLPLYMGWKWADPDYIRFLKGVGAR